VTSSTALYDDGRIAIDDEGISVRWYYLWGAKRIPFQAIRSTKTFPLSRFRGRWRLWGSGSLVRWYNLDVRRPTKTTGIEIDTGGRVHPCLTPDDVQAVSEIIAAHIPG
jgi:hypothetical protein